MKKGLYCLILLGLILFFGKQARAFETQDDMNEFGAKLAAHYVIQWYGSEYENDTARHVRENKRTKPEKFAWLIINDYLDVEEKTQLKKDCSSCWVNHQSRYEVKKGLHLKTDAIRLKIKIMF
jgi:hypothetical protein